MLSDSTVKAAIDSPRVQRAMAYGDKMAAIVNRTTADDWDALLPMIDAYRFICRGNERTEMDCRHIVPCSSATRPRS